MSAFFADISELEKLYMKNRDAMFRMAFLHANNSNDANEIIKSMFFKLYLNQKDFEYVTQDSLGVFHSLEKAISDFYRKRARKNLKEEKLKHLNLPFKMTDELVSVMHLPEKLKSAAALHFGSNFSLVDTAKILKISESSAEKRLAEITKKTKLSDAQLEETLSSILIDKSTHQRLWDKIEYEITETGFPGKQRLRNAKRGMDIAVPYIALGIILFCSFAFLGVHYGWLNGMPFQKSQPLEGIDTSVASDDIIYKMENYDYIESSGTNSNNDTNLTHKDLKIYVPEDGEYAEYIINIPPSSNSDFISTLRDYGLFSKEASLYINGDTAKLELDESEQIDEEHLTAIAKTLSVFTRCDNLSVTINGLEVNINGKTANDLLKAPISISKTTWIDRE